MSCLTNEDKDLIKFLGNFYLENLHEDAVELTDEVFDLIDKLEAEAWQFVLTTLWLILNHGMTIMI